MPKLSYDKLAKLLVKHHYIISLVYYGEKYRVLFIEARLPKTQKSVIVKIPDDYTMVAPKGGPKTVKIINTDSFKDHPQSVLLTEKSKKYVNDIRGPLITSDLAIVAVDGFCHSKFNGELECYYFASNLPEDDISEEIIEPMGNNDEKDVLAQLEEEMLRVAKRNGITVKTDKEPSQHKKKKHASTVVDIHQKETIEIEVKEPIEEEKLATSNDEISKEAEVLAKSDEEATDKSEDHKVELEFVEDEHLKGTSDRYEEDSELEPKKAKDDTVKDCTTRENDKELSKRSNVIFPEEMDVELGIVYVSINLTKFYKELSRDTLEPQLLEIYGQIEDNENDIRLSKIENIKKSLHLAAEHLEIQVSKLQTEERSLKFQLLRMSSILKTAEIMKTSYTEKLAVKEGDIITSKGLLSVDSIYHKTQKTAHELNMQLLRKKDEVEELLLNYEASLSDLFTQS